MDPSQFVVYKTPYSKYRIGNQSDGGYVVCNIPSVQYDLLLSGGVDNDSSFEDDFLNRCPTIQCFAYDGTIQRSPSKHPRFIWIPKNISDHTSSVVRVPVSERIAFRGGKVKTLYNYIERQTENPPVTNLHDVLQTHRSVFLKMDIEGYEIPWFESLNDNHMDRLSQIVIEFHSPFSERENRVFEKLNKTHVLVHIHGNNNCGTRVYKDIVFPNVFECTYIHKRYIRGDLEKNTEAFPTTLDRPNIPAKEEIYLDHWPFVSHSS
jgi:hypothetical protein